MLVLLMYRANDKVNQIKYNILSSFFVFYDLGTFHIISNDLNGDICMCFALKLLANTNNMALI